MQNDRVLERNTALKFSQNVWLLHDNHRGNIASYRRWWVFDILPGLDVHVSIVYISYRSHSLRFQAGGSCCVATKVLNTNERMN